METALGTIHYGVKNWWWYIIIGFLFIVTGIAIYARPADGYLGLRILFSAVMICAGFMQIFFSTANSNILKGCGWILTSGMLDLVIGSYLFLYPGLTMVTMPYFLGFWLVFRAFNAIGSSFEFKNLGARGWDWFFFGGIALLALGSLIIYYPATDLVNIIVVSGSAFILGGFLHIYKAFQLKSLKN